jgi:hypothetical protein
MADALDFADPELWKSNSFARLRARLIPYLQATIAKLQGDRYVPFTAAERAARLQRAREILNLLQQR